MNEVHPIVTELAKSPALQQRVGAISRQPAKPNSKRPITLAAETLKNGGCHLTLRAMADQPVQQLAGLDLVLDLVRLAAASEYTVRWQTENIDSDTETQMLIVIAEPMTGTVTTSPEPVTEQADVVK